MTPEGIVLIVENDPAKVELALAAGELACPRCGGVLARWSFARRRVLRDEDAMIRLRPRRGRCRECKVTHVLLPDLALTRRVDTVGVIGRALAAAAAGCGHHKAASLVERPASTVRGWLRRFSSAADRVASHFRAWAYVMDPTLGPIRPAGSALGDAVEAIGVAARASSLRLGPRPGWAWASVLSAGGLISNTNSLWPAP
jgi:hypothetical protein